MRTHGAPPAGESVGLARLRILDARLRPQHPNPLQDQKRRNKTTKEARPGIVETGPFVLRLQSPETIRLSRDGPP